MTDEAARLAPSSHETRYRRSKRKRIHLRTTLRCSLMRIHWLLSCLVLVVFQSNAQVRKCIDAQTKAVTYSNSSCPSGTGPTQIIVSDDSPTIERKLSVPAKPRPALDASVSQPQRSDAPVRPAPSNDCHKTTIREPQPFLGTANEVLVFSDRTIWRDVSYKYLYLYAYGPTVILCPSEGRMILESYVFQLVPVR